MLMCFILILSSTSWCPPCLSNLIICIAYTFYIFYRLYFTSYVHFTLYIYFHSLRMRSEHWDTLVKSPLFAFWQLQPDNGWSFVPETCSLILLNICCADWMKYSLVLSNATEMHHLHIMNMQGEKKRRQKVLSVWVKSSVAVANTFIT